MKTPEVKAAEEADRVQLVEALADGRVLMESVSAERDKVMDADRLREWHADCETAGENRLGYQWMERAGKHAAGRTLDGVIHDGYPTPRVPHV